MPDGVEHHFDNATGEENLGADGDDNLNSLTGGGNVFQTTGPGNELKVDVDSFFYWDNSGVLPVLTEFAGATAQALTPSATNFVFVDGTNLLVINTIGFPVSPSFIPLARVTTSATVITAFDDRRPRFVMF